MPRGIETVLRSEVESTQTIGQQFEADLNLLKDIYAVQAKKGNSSRITRELISSLVRQIFDSNLFDKSERIERIRMRY